METVKEFRQTGNKLPTNIEINTPQDRSRVEAEQFIRVCFRRMYGAEINNFMPTLMSLRDDDGDLFGVLGLRSARDGALFLEQYLDRPVEQILASKTNMPVDRDGLVEVGNLAAVGTGGGRCLITALTAYLFAAKNTWVVFTIGPVLHNAFKRLGLELIDLGPADPDQLPPEERKTWGSYYEQKPRVMAGRVASGYQIMQQRYRAKSLLTKLWLHAGQVGSLAA
jgi:hypothetical protein